MADQCHDLIRQLFFYRAQELVLPMLPASIGTAASPVPGMSGAGEPRPAGRATVLDAVFFDITCRLSSSWTGSHALKNTVVAAHPELGQGFL